MGAFDGSVAGGGVERCAAVGAVEGGGLHGSLLWVGVFLTQSRKGVYLIIFALRHFRGLNFLEVVGWFFVTLDEENLAQYPPGG